jgi:hypothetical protein
MTKDKKELKKMTDFEYDCVWMSIRYAIGRHTIASNHHAGAIVSNCYGRFITEERQEFTAYDINREIEMKLRWIFDFYCNEYELGGRENYRPLDLFFEFLNEYDITSAEQLKNIKRIYMKYDNTLKKVVYDVKYEEEGGRERFAHASDIGDLEIWQLAANCLDRTTHKKAILIDGSECVYFDGWMRGSGKGDLYYVKKHIPVDSFLKNWVAISYIPDENIKEIVSDFNDLPY